jgi:3,4-dihydroxy 2-butanone 4-phosphate synthase
MEVVKEAIENLRLGNPVLIYDWPYRESEVDMVFYAGKITPEKIYKLRTEAGGLICYGLSYDVAQSLEIPMFDEVLTKSGFANLVSKSPGYGDRSNLAVWVNSIKTRTGISDFDRALTIKSLHELVELVSKGKVTEAKNRFQTEFYAPGHVPILVAKHFKERCGHTELAVWLAVTAELLPSVVYAEMLKFNSSITFEEAVNYADNKGLVLVTGEDLLRYLQVRR